MGGDQKEQWADGARHGGKDHTGPTTARHRIDGRRDARVAVTAERDLGRDQDSLASIAPSASAFQFDDIYVAQLAAAVFRWKIGPGKLQRIIMSSDCML